MATNETGNSLSVVDKRFNFASNASPISATTHNAVKDQAAIDAQLTTLNGSYYTTAMLQSMNLNDKIFALRVGYDAAGI